MARITTYPNDSNVTAGDKLIGTDVDNLDATKNFTVGSLQSFFGLTFVPYTGATQNVDLGNFWLITNGKGSFGQLDVNGPTALTGTTTVNGFLTASAIKAQFGLQLQSGPFEIGNALNPGNPGDLLVSQGFGVEPSWVSNTAFLQPLMASFYSDLDQTDQESLVNGPNIMVFNQTYFSAGLDITMANNPVGGSPTFGQPTRITFSRIGKFKIDLMAQFVKIAGGGTQKASVWLRYNTGNIANSNRHSAPLSTGDYGFLAFSFVVDITTIGDYIDICWQGANLKLEHDAPTVGPTPLPRPANPSCSFVVTLVS